MLEFVLNRGSLLFRLNGTVDSWTYAKWGSGLALFKYLVEAVVLWQLCDAAYTPIDYLNPLLSSREQFLADAPPWLGFAFIIWTLPFVWIAFAMSIRRCRDLDVSPWWATLVLVPVANFIAMFVLASFRGSNMAIDAEIVQVQGEYDELADVWRSPQCDDSGPPSNASPPSTVVPAILGILAGATYAIVLTILSVYAFDTYGSALFFGTPIVAGATSGYLLNRSRTYSIWQTLGHTSLMVFTCSAGLLLFALEGAICIAMAIPILLPLAYLGALVGRTIAVETNSPQREQRGLVGCLLVLPMLASVEPLLQPAPLLSVSTSLEIAAPPERVWQSVVSFPDIGATPAWYFRMGIAAPLRARIEGTGVGAVRYCEFTTGTFVEPITDWDEPTRLAFRVTDQPDPMAELSPYRHLHPPHLDHSLKSERGEFQLIPQANGHTRLVGTTWYRLNIHPRGYWTVWSDALMHRIHARVLEHIRQQAENQDENQDENRDGVQQMVTIMSDVR